VAASNDEGNTMTRTSTARRQVSAAAERIARPLTNDDRLTAFRSATGSFVAWYAGQIEAGMTDPELEAALEVSFGIMGGSCGPGRMHVTYQGPGLRIWATWEITSHYGTRPIFAGHATVAMAREVYGIANPQDRQMRLV
jgi:hypothetical protein